MGQQDDAFLKLIKALERFGSQKELHVSVIGALQNADDEKEYLARSEITFRFNGKDEKDIGWGVVVTFQPVDGGFYKVVLKDSSNGTPLAGELTVTADEARHILAEAENVRGKSTVHDYLVKKEAAALTRSFAERYPDKQGTLAMRREYTANLLDALNEAQTELEQSGFLPPYLKEAFGGIRQELNDFVNGSNGVRPEAVTRASSAAAISYKDHKEASEALTSFIEQIRIQRLEEPLIERDGLLKKQSIAPSREGYRDF